MPTAPFPALSVLPIIVERSPSHWVYSATLVEPSALMRCDIPGPAIEMGQSWRFGRALHSHCPFEHMPIIGTMLNNTHPRCRLIEAVHPDVREMLRKQQSLERPSLLLDRRPLMIASYAPDSYSSHPPYRAIRSTRGKNTECPRLRNPRSQLTENASGKRPANWFLAYLRQIRRLLPLMPHKIISFTDEQLHHPLRHTQL